MDEDTKTQVTHERGVQPSGCAPGKVLVASGIAGAGKGAVLAELCRRRPDRYVLIKQITTRARRELEDGYVFATAAEFEEMRDCGELVADIVCCQHYAFDKQTILLALAEGKIPILDADYQTFHQLMEWEGMKGRVYSVFLIGPSEEWKHRSGDPEMRRYSLRRFQTVISQYGTVLVNNNVGETCQQIEKYLEEGMAGCYRDTDNFQVQLDAAIAKLEQQT